MQEVQTATERVSPLESDLIAMKFSPKSLMHLEAELFGTKWFDYRMMTVYDATILYANTFNDIYRRIFAVEFDRSRAQHVVGVSIGKMLEGLKSGDSHAKKRFSGLWRGRQVADALGMPYSEYIDMAMRRRLRFWKRGNLPRPDQIYGQLDVEWVQSKWQEAQAAKLYLAEHPAYEMRNYAGLAHQNDYHEWLFAQANYRANPFYQLAQFVNEGRLPIEKVRARVDADLIDRVERHIRF